MTPAWQVRISSSAERDLESILAWTRRHFGSRQHATYATTLGKALRALTEGSDATGIQSRDDMGPGVRVLHVARDGRRGRHFIVFRAQDDARRIDVLRVLHDSMDLAQHVAVEDKSGGGA